MLIFLAWALITVVVIMIGPVLANDEAAVSNDIGTIHISADSLVVPGGTENHAEFSGNVHAVGDRFEITADQLKIFYQPASGTEGDIVPGNTLTMIVASGNVVITSGERIAKTDMAVYDKERQTIILTGEQSRVLQNNSYISGEKIIMHMDSDAVTVESGDKKRVEAFIEAQDIKKNN